VVVYFGPLFDEGIAFTQFGWYPGKTGFFVDHSSFSTSSVSPFIREKYSLNMFFGTVAHIHDVLSRIKAILTKLKMRTIYKKASLTWIPPELREGDTFIEKRPK